MTSLVTFDLLPTDDWFPIIFAFPDNKTLNASFEDFDFKQFFIMNLGNLFIMILVTLFQFPIYYLARCCNSNSYGMKIQKYFEVS